MDYIALLMSWYGHACIIENSLLHEMLHVCGVSLTPFERAPDWYDPVDPYRNASAIYYFADKCIDSKTCDMSLPPGQHKACFY